MDFSLTTEQHELRDATTDFARRTLTDDLRGRDRRSEFSRELWNHCAEFGIQGLPIPEAYGGRGFDTVTTVLAMEALGEGCRDNGLLFGINAQMWSVQMPILRFGTERQKETYLRPMCDGTMIGAHAMSEPSAGATMCTLGGWFQSQRLFSVSSANRSGRCGSEVRQSFSIGAIAFGIVPSQMRPAAIPKAEFP